MKLSTLIKSTTAAIFLSASMAAAQIPAEFANDPVVLQLAEQLAAEGFEITEVKITLLGRYKIEAVASGYKREIVLAAGAGTILRDNLEKTDSADGTGSDDNGLDDNGTDDNGLDDNGSDDNGSDDNGSDDNGSDDNGSDDNGSDDSNSDDNGSDDDGSDDDGSDDS